MKLSIEKPDSFFVSPILGERKDAFDIDSMDLRLGTHFLLPRIWQQPHFCPDERSAGSLHLPLEVPLGRYLVVPAHQTVLGATLEFIKMPNDCSGLILTKSSVARTFIVVETAPWVHPGYRGCLTLEMANVSNTPILLYPGRRIAQLVLQSTNVSAPDDGTLDPDYLGPVFPEVPPFHNPEYDLDAIGVRPTWVIPEPKPVE